jgi:hypothetical protein
MTSETDCIQERLQDRRMFVEERTVALETGGRMLRVFPCFGFPWPGASLITKATVLKRSS